MDAVSEVLIARSVKSDALSSLVGASAVVHVVLIGAFVFLPAAWFGAENKPPETIMNISLGGPVGPKDGGLATLGGRTIQQAVPVEAEEGDRARASPVGEATRDGRADQGAATKESSAEDRRQGSAWREANRR